MRCEPRGKIWRTRVGFSQPELFEGLQRVDQGERFGAPMDDGAADLWFTYFAHATSHAGTWSPGPFGLVFQRTMLHTSRRLERRPEALYPDLSELGVESARRSSASGAADFGAPVCAWVRQRRGWPRG